MRRREFITLLGGATVGWPLAARAQQASMPTIGFIGVSVFGIADDPVRRGLVASLARPGGNITGINFLTGELAAKRLALLQELVPRATRVVALLNSADGLRAEAIEKDIQGAARGVGLQIRILNASTSREI